MVIEACMLLLFVFFYFFELPNIQCIRRLCLCNRRILPIYTNIFRYAEIDVFCVIESEWASGLLCITYYERERRLGRTRRRIDRDFLSLHTFYEWIGWLTVFILMLMIVMMNIWPFLVEFGKLSNSSCLFFLSSCFCFVYFIFFVIICSISLYEDLWMCSAEFSSYKNRWRMNEGERARAPFICRTRQQIRYYYYCHLVYLFSFCLLLVLLLLYSSVVVVVTQSIFMAIFLSLSFRKESHSCWLVWVWAMGNRQWSGISYTCSRSLSSCAAGSLAYNLCALIRCMAIHRLISWTSRGMLNYTYVPW